jgi:hypothetical protein
MTHTPRAAASRRGGAARAAAALLAALACTAGAQTSIEPRAYSNAPVGTNFLISGYSETRGGVAFDSALPVSDPKLTVRSGVLGYATVMDLWGRTAKFDIVVPYSALSGSAAYEGVRTRREVSGFGDPLLRLSWNFLGAPALRLREFLGYRQDLIVGASLQVSVPAGQYDSRKLVNLGNNRWFVKPEIGASKAIGAWTLELKSALTWFSANDDFFGGNRRTQDLLYSLQGHVIHDFGAGRWVSVDATYFTGGRTSLNGVPGNDLQRNWRTGVTFSLPVGASDSLKLYASSGVAARTGNNHDLIGIAWQHRWSDGP